MIPAAKLSVVATRQYRVLAIDQAAPAGDPMRKIVAGFLLCALIFAAFIGMTLGLAAISDALR